MTHPSDEDRSPTAAARPPRRPGRAWGVLVLGLALAGVALLGTGAWAQGSPGNAGDIKVHDGAGADPDERNEPHVTGDVWVEGFNMAATGGPLQIFTWPPTGDRTLVVDTTWTTDGGEPENHFLAGPFVLPCGHYRVEADNGDEPNDFPGGPKVKMFWVDCQETPPPPPTSSSTTTTTAPPTTSSGTSTTSASETGTETSSGSTTTSPPPPPSLLCPTGLTATSNDDGSVLLQWTPAAGSDGTNVYRAEGTGDFDYVTTVGPGVSSYLDTDAAAAGDYAYTVTGLFGNEESVDCPVVERSAIPDFPTLLGLGLASAGGLLAVLRRRLP